MSSEMDEILPFPDSIRSSSIPRMKMDPRFSQTYEDKIDFREQRVFTPNDDHVKHQNYSYLGGTLV